VLLGFLPYGIDPSRVVAHIRFGSHYDHRLVHQLVVEFSKLAEYDIEIVGRVAAAEIGDVHHMDQQAGALDVSQKLRTQAASFMRPLDQTGNIGQHKRTITGLHNTQIRLQRGERIICDFRLRGGETRDQRRFSRIGEPDQPDVGQQLKLEAQPQHLTGLAFFMLGRRLMCGAREASVAPPAASSGSHRKGLARCRKVDELLARIGIVNDGSNWNRKLHPGSIAAGTIAALPMTPALGSVFRIKTKMQKSVVVLARDQRNIAAAAAISPTWSASRDELFSPECQTSVTSVSGFDGNNYFINKHEKDPTEPERLPVLPEVTSVFNMSVQADLALCRDYIYKFTKSAAVAEFYRAWYSRENSIVLA
jgi:hypothetical protein